ncbi:hypothetical protein NAC44_07600 [Allorhizobium sp. BGMRC 0089]|uniref:hypothetical protein n=1 Tax=Allorhizobium sonneratiae TaxID=2934936 RepID=UPI0020334230|nr:hypothetical protein [Allorhizobium sonneratiae]MCM2292190.1 hypothetical protein [Allorhizobium sonneratiae]
MQTDSYRSLIVSGWQRAVHHKTLSIGFIHVSEGKRHQRQAGNKNSNRDECRDVMQNFTHLPLQSLYVFILFYFCTIVNKKEQNEIDGVSLL